jgi:transcriptional regulator with XRE-family HTH domain
MLKESDQDISVKIGRVMRTARKLKGLSQIEIAASLGVNQATLSRYESGRLVPSVKDWYKFCQTINIDSQKTYLLGVIDNHSKLISGLYYNNSFKLPDKYKNTHELKVRDLFPFWTLIKETYSEKEIKDWCKLKKIDSDIFYAHDMQVSFSLVTDLYDFLKTSKSSSVILKDLVQISSNLEYYGFVEEEFLAQNEPIKIIKKFVLDSDFCNGLIKFSQLKTIEKNKTKFELKIKNSFMDDVDVDADAMSTYLEFKLNTIQKIAQLNSSKPKSVKVINNRLIDDWNLGLEIAV